MRPTTTVPDLSLHLAPNAPWIVLAIISLGLVALGMWAYRFAIPPMPVLARRSLTGLRLLALLALLWLLAQPVLERTAVAGSTRIIALVDRSSSMALPVAPGGPTRAAAAAAALEELKRAWRGRATLDEAGFARGLDSDSLPADDGATAFGDALTQLARTPEGRRASGIVLLSDGAINAGDDPVRAAAAFGIPVHTITVGATGAADRSIGDVLSSSSARVGEATPVRARITSSEPSGVPLNVRLMDGTRELARTTVLSPGDGAEVIAEFSVTPARAGLAVWTAVLDSLEGEITASNNARQVALEVAPGRLGVTIVTGGLNWDLAFMRRALLGDSSLRVTTWSRDRGAWAVLENPRRRNAPGSADLRGQSVVIIDGIAPAAVGSDFDAALARFVRGGGGVMLLGGPIPGLSRYRTGALGPDLQFALDAGAITRSAAPAPAPEGRELTAWDDDPARGEGAWRAAAPVTDLVPLKPSQGDRVLVGALGGGPPIVLSRRIGRGQALLVNGTGSWRWSLSPHDDLSAERGKKLWRRLARWLAEPVQGEPLRVRPERWLSAGGETVRLFATLQDDRFRPVEGAGVTGEIRGPGGSVQRVAFDARAAGSYGLELSGLEPGRYSVSVRARSGAADLGRASTEFAVDRWSLEAARTRPDSLTLAAVARASGGEATGAGSIEAWARTLSPRDMTRRRTESTRLWESPWVFAIVVGMLGIEWAWRRRRGLP